MLEKQQAGEPESTESAEGEAQKESDEAKRDLKRKLDTDEPNKSASREDAAALEQEVDEDANDQVRLWEDGWKQRYYKVKFNVEDEDVEFRRKIVRALFAHSKIRSHFRLFNTLLSSFDFLSP